MRGPRVEQDARLEELAQPVEAEHPVAQSHQSGTRPVVQQVPDEVDTWSFDPHNAVTKVQRAIELDAFLPPTVEVTVVVSEIVALGPPKAHSEATTAPAQLSDFSPVTGASSTSRLPHADEQPAPSASRYRARRAIAALLVVATMAGACALLLTAAWRAHVRLPPPLGHLVERAIRVTRAVSGASR